MVKPTFGRVGEDITIHEVISKKDLNKISLNAFFFPKNWVAQKKFNSFPLKTKDGNKHICIGVFVIDGKACGFYGRMSDKPRIDSNAQEMAILIEKN
ncbi:hypothetical protein HY745_08345 [Candidatus Desantisbacteria bacterium]|nr:hypothetical protein [Candidatus Desantisbacteria bacterium]